MVHCDARRQLARVHLSQNNPKTPVPIGFTKHPRFRFRINDRDCLVNQDGVATIERVSEIYRAYLAAKKVTWLLSFRDQIKEIELLNCRSVLSLIVERTRDPRLRLLAIWLRGRCGGYIGTLILARHSTSPHFRIRKEVARALQRMSAWTILSKMAEKDVDERIRRIASPLLPKSYRSRLDDFSRNVQAIRVASLLTRPTWISPGVEMTDGKAPRSPAFIRQILERIHRLVIGSSSYSTSQKTAK